MGHFKERVIDKHKYHPWETPTATRYAKLFLCVRGYFHIYFHPHVNVHKSDSKVTAIIRLSEKQIRLMRVPSICTRMPTCQNITGGSLWLSAAVACHLWIWIDSCRFDQLRTEETFGFPVGVSVKSIDTFPYLPSIGTNCYFSEVRWGRSRCLSTSTGLTQY
jgi:hypothetical protein